MHPPIPHSVLYLSIHSETPCCVIPRRLAFATARARVPRQIPCIRLAKTLLAIHSLIHLRILSFPITFTFSIYSQTPWPRYTLHLQRGRPASFIRIGQPGKRKAFSSLPDAWHPSDTCRLHSSSQTSRHSFIYSHIASFILTPPHPTPPYCIHSYIPSSHSFLHPYIHSETPWSRHTQTPCIRCGARSHACPALVKHKHLNPTSSIQIATTRVAKRHTLFRLDLVSFIHTMTTRVKQKYFRRCRTPGIRHAQTCAFVNPRYPYVPLPARTLLHSFLHSLIHPACPDSLCLVTLCIRCGHIQRPSFTLDNQGQRKVSPSLPDVWYPSCTDTCIRLAQTFLHSYIYLHIASFILTFRHSSLHYHIHPCIPSFPFIPTSLHLPLDALVTSCPEPLHSRRARANATRTRARVYLLPSPDIQT